MCCKYLCIIRVRDDIKIEFGDIDVHSGMVLAEDIYARDDLPPFRASVMVKYISK